MNVHRGDLVLADLLFSDRSGSKVRPALVVSTDANNTAIDDVILVAISSRTRAGALTHVLVDPRTPDGRSSGLLFPSYLQCENLFTLDKQFIVHQLGRLSP